MVRISSDTVSDSSTSTFEISTDTSTCNIVIIGYSTAAGTGASVADSPWVNRLAAQVADNNTKYTVTNLAIGGYTTFHLLPTGSTLGNGVGISVDVNRNITRALELDPYAIIINLPSNDAARFFTVEAQLRNFGIIDSTGRAGGANVFITTTQSRNFIVASALSAQMEVRDSIFSIYGDYAIDFWNGLAASDGTILPDVDSGDGAHVNDLGHRIIAQRVFDKQIDTLSCDGTSSLFPEPFATPGTLDVQAYPNPTSSGEITVVVADLTTGGAVRVEWFDQIGRILQTSTINQTGNSSFTTTLSVPTTGQGTSIRWCKMTALKSGESSTIKVVAR